MTARAVQDVQRARSADLGEGGGVGPQHHLVARDGVHFTVQQLAYARAHPQQGRPSNGHPHRSESSGVKVSPRVNRRHGQSPSRLSDSRDRIGVKAFHCLTTKLMESGWTDARKQSPAPSIVQMRGVQVRSGLHSARGRLFSEEHSGLCLVQLNDPEEIPLVLLNGGARRTRCLDCGLSKTPQPIGDAP